MFALSKKKILVVQAILLIGIALLLWYDRTREAAPLMDGTCGYLCEIGSEADPNGDGKCDYSNDGTCPFHSQFSVETADKDACIAD